MLSHMKKTASPEGNEEVHVGNQSRNNNNNMYQHPGHRPEKDDDDSASNKRPSRAVNVTTTRREEMSFEKKKKKNPKLPEQKRRDLVVASSPGTRAVDLELDKFALHRREVLSSSSSSSSNSSDAQQQQTSEDHDERNERMNEKWAALGVSRYIGSPMPPSEDSEQQEDNNLSSHEPMPDTAAATECIAPDTALCVDQHEENTAPSQEQSSSPFLENSEVGLGAGAVRGESSNEDIQAQRQDTNAEEAPPSDDDLLVVEEEEEGAMLSADVSAPTIGVVETEGEIIATSYVARTREQIELEAMQNAEVEFQQQLSTAIHVKAVRERTPKERLILWSLLILGTFAVVLGVVLGVVFGVVVESKDKAVTYDVCEGAEGPLRELITKGSTVGTQMNDTAPLCSGLVANGQYGVWYYLEGESNNEYISASTCSNNDTTFDTQLSIFEGTSCSKLLCMDANDDYCGNQSSVFWRTTAGTRYYILVHGKGSQQGDFRLTVQRESRFELMTAEIFREFGVQLNPPGDVRSPQYRAAEWLVDSDTFIEVPLRTPSDRLQFRQRYALAVFYFSMRGTLLKDNLNFLSPESVCYWRDEDGEGVTCDLESIVRDLAIVSCKCPYQCFVFTESYSHLFRFHTLGRNEISGKIPSELAGLDSLQTLHFYGHDFGPSLQIISRLSSLKSLRLSSCNLNEKLLTEIGALTALTSLELSSDTTLTGSIPDEIQNLSNLQYLQLSRIYVAGSIPTELMKLTLLTSLLLPTGYMGGRIPSEIGQLSRLRKLDLSNNVLGLVRTAGVVPTQIGTLSLIEELDLRDAFIRSSEHAPERISEAIGNLKNLRRLHLRTYSRVSALFFIENAI